MTQLPATSPNSPKSTLLVEVNVRAECAVAAQNRVLGKVEPRAMMRVRRTKCQRTAMSHSKFSKIKTYRKRNAFTQKELAFLLGLNQHVAISRHERGLRAPDLRTAFGYQTLFNQQLPALFPGLLEQTRAEVKTRAAQLAQNIRRRGHDRRAPYKLKQLERLTQNIAMAV